MPEELDIADAKQKVHEAMKKLLVEDKYLFEQDVNERSITHKFALYLQQEFEGWHVDCEYNREGHHKKELMLPRKKTMVDDVHAKTVFPDIIIHERGSNEKNFIVIEVKKSTNPERTGDWDRKKLDAFLNQHLNYKLGFSICFDTRNDTHRCQVWWRCRDSEWAS